MEGNRFSPENLEPSVLEKEQTVYSLAVERVKETIEREVDFAMIADIFGDMYKKCFPDIINAELDRLKENIKNPIYEVKYVLTDSKYLLSDKDDEETEDGEINEHSAHTDGKIIRYSASIYYSENGQVDTTLLIKDSIHELLHIFAGALQNFGTGELFSTGISHTRQIKNGEEFNFFDSINEGLTEVMVDAVFSEYFARKGDLNSYDNQEDVYLEDGQFDIPSRHMAYETERCDIYKLMNEIGEVSGFSNEIIAQALVREYLTNGYLLREEIVEAFKDFPKIITILRAHESNLSDGITDEELFFLHNQAHTVELSFIKALFGRDVIGKYNKKVIESL